jgi:hypothetical protein
MTDAGPGADDAPTGLPAERLRPSNFALNNGGCPNFIFR